MLLQARAKALGNYRYLRVLVSRGWRDRTVGRAVASCKTDLDSENAEELVLDQFETKMKMTWVDYMGESTGWASSNMGSI